MTDTIDVDHVTRTAAHLSLIEIAVGSVVHGLKLPLAGHALSLNQGFFLTHALRHSTTRFNAAQQSIEISSVSSVLKSLSPAGNKIGPMLSIATQGVLYSIGILILGRRLAGQILGMALLSLWAFIQPLITLFIIHGSQLEKVIGFYWKRISEDLPQISQSLVLILGFFVVAKVLMAISIPFVIKLLGPEKISNFENKILLENKLIRMKSRPQNRSPLKGALKDLTHPLFLLSMGLVIVYFFMTESSYVRLFWYCLRPIAIAFILFYLLRSPRFIEFLARMAQKNRFCNKIYQRTLQSQIYIQTWLSK
jgi:hypothetical protein